MLVHVFNYPDGTVTSVLCRELAAKLRTTHHRTALKSEILRPIFIVRRFSGCGHLTLTGDKTFNTFYFALPVLFYN